MNMDAVIAAPKPVIERRIDDPKRNIETRILVFEALMPAMIENKSGSALAASHFAQVYRRMGGAGEWVIVHTTKEPMPTEFHALTDARIWHRKNPTTLLPEVITA